MKPEIKIAIFASGNGSNAQNLITFFKGSRIKIALILTENPHARVLERAALFQVPTLIFTKAELQNGKILEQLKHYEINYIVLAGFLKLIPASVVQSYQQRIINIHPALLPKFGGKGMYGSHVHKAVFDAHETETGITIHYVNEFYDKGDIILQKHVSLTASDTPESIAFKISDLEMKYFPEAILQTIEKHNA